ncbi:hypothetical protein ES703_123873 [subsurface metagenome]
MSAKCRPVVGSSKRYKVLPVFLFPNSLDSFILCASPPERVVAGCPSFMYPSPTLKRVSNLPRIWGIGEKNSMASATVISSTSAIFFPLYRISRVSRLYLSPLQTSQVTYTSGRKCISILIIPSPLQASHLPPSTLKLNLPDL